MGKKKKRETDSSKVSRTETAGTVSLVDRFNQPSFILGYFILLFLVIVFLYKPIILDGMEPNGSDFISNIGVTHQLVQWEENTGHFPLWNPYQFAGIPQYHRAAPKAWSVDTLLNGLDFLGDWRLWYFLAGALGVYLLVVYLGLPGIVAMVSGLAFILMPHFQALIIVGHFSKFRALMWIPYVLLTFLYLVRERTLLSALLFSLAFAIQFRTQHYQIIFYTLMLLLFFGIPPLLKYIREKNLKAVSRLTLLALGALLFAFIISAQTFLSIREYTPYSTRGGYAVSLENGDQDQKEQKGVGFDYATSWSYSVSEFWSLIIPRFHGGTSDEIYTGDAVPALKNRQIPAYWGAMPFTQSYEYLGILVAFLAVLGIVLAWERWEVKSFTFLTLLALLMSLGKNFPVVYKSFFYYIPYFDKFRAPVMILTLVMFNFSVLAAFGLAFLMQNDLNRKEFLNRIYFITGLFAFFLAIPLIFGSTFSYSQGNEVERYGQQVFNMLKRARQELLINSALKSLIFFLLGTLAVFGIRKKWFRPAFLPLLFLVLIGADFLILNSHYLKGKFIDPEKIERSRYEANAIDREISADNELFRVFPFGRLFSDVHWVYYHQSIGGYSAAKLQEIQEVVDNCLYQYLDQEIPINWNILKILNVKYVVMPQRISHSKLVPVAAVESSSMFGYRYTESSPRLHFARNYEVIPDGVDRLKMLNNPAFDPDSTAILEEQPETEVFSPDSATAKVIEFTPDRIRMEVYTDKTSLLVISEIDYPPGWKAILDGSRELTLYKTSHLVQSVIIPAGEHSLELNFHPDSYYAGVTISVTSIVLLYILIAFLGYRRWGNQFTVRLKGRKADYNKQ